MYYNWSTFFYAKSSYYNFLQYVLIYFLTGCVSQTKTSPRSRHSSSSPSSSPGRHPTSSPAIDPMYINHYCVPCKIKFSSVDTLLCHQQYYCPSRQLHVSSPGGVVSSAVSPRTHGDSRDRPTADTHQCIHCDQIYASVRMLKMHQCPASQSEGDTNSTHQGHIHVPMLRCPYCEYVTQSDTRLVEHIKAHAPTRAYKCIICGYRGNTVRGMRMHGKIHADHVEHFTDDNMIVIEQPALIPKRFRTSFSDSTGTVGGDTSSAEAELIRLKNEPYKRRRSRKGYEKSENMGAHITVFSCHLCNHLCSDGASLATHIQHCHEKSQLQIHHCKYCDFRADNKNILVRHVNSHSWTFNFWTLCNWCNKLINIKWHSCRHQTFFGWWRIL